MSKYDPLWMALRDKGDLECQLTFEEIRIICGFEIDHSFLNYKKEARAYGYEVGKISLKEKHILFKKIG